jgi:hypothetical protein
MHRGIFPIPWPPPTSSSPNVFAFSGIFQCLLVKVHRLRIRSCLAASLLQLSGPLPGRYRAVTAPLPRSPILGDNDVNGSLPPSSPPPLPSPYLTHFPGGREHI